MSNQNEKNSRVQKTALAVMLVILSVGWATNVSFSKEPNKEYLNDGLLHYQQGRIEKAVQTWSQGLTLSQFQRRPRAYIQTEVFLGKAYMELGETQQAFTLLQAASNNSKKLSHEDLLAQSLNQLGNLYLKIGDTKSALTHFQESLEIAKQIQHFRLMAHVYNDRGNAYALRQENAEALASYKQGHHIASQHTFPNIGVRTKINAALVEVRQRSGLQALPHLKEAWTELQNLPPTPEKVQNLLTIGTGLQQLEPQLNKHQAEITQLTLQSYREAAQLAQDIGDWRGKTYAWGLMGELYEKKGRDREALHLARLAIRASQEGEVPEALYRWEWKTGRYLKNLGHPEEAIQAYQRAIDTLQPIRPQLVLGLPSHPTSFRESVGLLFFEMADMLIERADQEPDVKKREALLFQTRDTIESFKAAELQDYFKDDCVEVNKARIQPIDQVSQSTAIIYPIIFPDRTEVLLSLEDTIKKITIPISQQELTEQIHLFRTLLEKRTTHQYLPHAQVLYNLLIRPLEDQFQEFGVTTLVFVPDGALRTIPMAPLHDGNQFLIQKFSLATTPGLTLTDAHSLDREKVSLLSVGLTEGVQGFPPLPNVDKEITSIQKVFGGKILLNKDFLVDNLKRQMKDEKFTVIHIASHGKFEQDTKDSFLLTYDKKLTMGQLGNLIGLFQFRQTPLDLLTLSACETAAGDDRAALGLAGVAVKAGARSALATLWFINDKASSDLVTQFYTYLKEKTASKAETLRQAQLSFLDHPIYRHPSYWAPFLLINNWL